MDLENKDALDLYSSALYGYQHSVPIAVASNSRFKQIAFDPFEDYGFAINCTDTCITTHFDYGGAIDSADAEIDDTYAHTGKHSLKLLTGTASSKRDIESYNDSTLNKKARIYKLKNGGCIQQFSPNSGQYLLSAWVKQGIDCNVTTYEDTYIRIHYEGSGSDYDCYPAGPIIDGWQRIESKFSVPGAADAIYVDLISSAEDAWFDDVRILPIKGSMKSYVYDPVSLRLMATLDENNYATFYEYDDKGVLVRTKRETEHGIATLQENRDSYQNK